MRGGQVVVSCEHATNAMPRKLCGLGLSKAVLHTHQAWDPGAAANARAIARRLRCPVHLGKVSRLVVELNRSPENRGVVPRKIGGIDVPGNAHLDAAGRKKRLTRWYWPFHEAVEADVRRAIERHGACLHLSSHSFTPVLRGVRRDADVGILFDPSRPRERAFARLLREALGPSGLRVRFNYPYRGTSDGFTRHLRTVHADRLYAGIELEVNQALVHREPRQLTRTVTAAVAEAVERAAP